MSSLCKIPLKKLDMSSLSKIASRSSTHEDHVELRRGPWTVEEDLILLNYIASHGEGRWNLLAKLSGLRRTGKSCRLRWLNYLTPDVKRGNLTPEEQHLILELHSKWGNRWSRIAHFLPGRTDNEIKNYCRNRVQKQARQLKINSKSATFQEVIRCFLIPCLLEKIQRSSPPLGMLSRNLAAAATTQPPQVLSPETAYSWCHPGKNSSSEQYCTRPNISSSESMNFSHIPQISEYSITSPFQTFSISSVAAPGDFENSIDDCDANESNWNIGSELTESVWNMD